MILTENFSDAIPVSWSHHLQFEPVSTAQNDHINDIGWNKMTTSLPVLEFCYSFRANVRLLQPVESINLSTSRQFTLNYDRTHLSISTLSPDQWDKEEQDPAQLHGRQAKKQNARNIRNGLQTRHLKVGRIPLIFFTNRQQTC